MPTNHIVAPVWGIWILTPLNSDHDVCSVVCRIGPYYTEVKPLEPKEK